jgi:hypothetical protein
MNLSLRNLFRTRSGRAPARTSPRSARTTRLEVEALEERAVPTMNLKGYVFPMPGATLSVSNEIGNTFWGTFADATSGINVPVTGQLAPLGPPQLDAMHFGGMAQKGLETEQVVFNGQLHEGPSPLMMGQLTEHYALPIAMWTTTRFVESYGRWIGPFPFAALPGTSYGLSPDAGAAAMPVSSPDAIPVASSFPLDPVAVNPQPLPPG